MNYIIDKIDDHEYYHDLFINNLKYVSENEFIEPWPFQNVKTINLGEKKNSIIKYALNEFIEFSNFKNALDKFFNKNTTIKNYKGWVNRYGKDEFQVAHNHNQGYGYDLNSEKNLKCVFVYFLDIPENSNCFNFCDKDGNNKKYINEKSGDLLIFDKFSYHSVDKNNSDQFRYTLAGNVEIE